MRTPLTSTNPKSPGRRPRPLEKLIAWMGRWCTSIECSIRFYGFEKIEQNLSGEKLYSGTIGGWELIVKFSDESA